MISVFDAMLRLCAILNKSLSGQKTLGRVAEWQTRWLQVPVSFGTWGFKSPFAHHDKTVDPSVGFTVFACFGLWGEQRGCRKVCTDFVQRLWSTLSSVLMLKHENALLCSLGISTFYADV